MTPLEPGALFKTSVGALYRFLAVCTDEPKPAAYVLSMEEAQSLPRAIPMNALIAGLNAGEYRPVAEATQTQERHAPSVISRSAAAVHQLRRGLIEPLVADKGIYEPEHRAKLVSARALETGTSPAHVVACLQMFWRGGMTFDTLPPAFFACGEPEPTVPGQADEARPAKRPAGDAGAL